MSLRISGKSEAVIRLLWIGLLAAGWIVSSDRLWSQEKEGVVATDPTPRVPEWERPLVGAWKQRPLREILHKISDAQRVSLVLDRRIDPDQRIDFSAEGKAAAEEIQRLAEHLGAGASVLGRVAYLGPKPRARMLQTLMVLRKEDLIPRRRSPVGTWMFKAGDFGWEDLEKPREIVQRWITQGEMKISNPELIREDRWGGAQLVGLTPIEALSIVLIQGDLTFAVDPSRKELTLKAIPERGVVSRQIGALKGNAVERKASLEKLQQEFAEVSLEVSGQRVKGTGEWEELLRVRERLSEKPKSGAPVDGPLKEQRFTLRLRDVPLRQVMEEFRKGGVEFEYDQKIFEEKGIDLESKPEMEVEEMLAGELFEKLFEPLGVSVELEGMTVRLKVK